VRFYNYKGLVKQATDSFSEETGKLLIASKQKLNNSQRIVERVLFPVLHSPTDILQMVDQLNSVNSGKK
jgi:hypothetical protein